MDVNVKGYIITFFYDATVFVKHAFDLTTSHVSKTDLNQTNTKQVLLFVLN